MSNIGKQPINIPDGVEIKISGNNIFVKGIKGELSLDFDSKIKINYTLTLFLFYWIWLFKLILLFGKFTFSSKGLEFSSISTIEF